MAATAADTTDASTAGLALAEANINWERLDKTKFHVIGAILFTAQQGVLHPTAVVKTRMQVAEGGLSQMSGFAVFRKILRSDGIPGAFRGFGTTAVGALPGRVLALTSLEMSKEMAFKYSEHFDMSETSRIAVANGVAGLVSSIFSSSYFVPLDVICQRLMVQGLPGMQTYRGPFDVINKVVRTEGLRGLYRGFGITMLTQSPASALWWSSYGGAQHAIWRSLGYGNHTQKKPSQTELVAVQATAGTIAGACSSIITTPIDTIKTRLQPTRRAPAIAPPTTTSFSTLPTTLHAVAGVEASLAMEADVAAAMVVTATEEVATAATTKATVATAPTREAATTATVVTTRGGVYGHDALRCYQRFNHGIQPETGASSICIAHYNANDQYTSDPNWYLDSGATDHMTNDLERLHTHKNYRGNEQIQVANGSHHEGNSTSR